MSKFVEVKEIAPNEMVLIKELHSKMGIDYDFPNLSGPLFAIRKMIMNKKGRVTAAAALKLTSEAFLWIDPDSPDYDKTSDILRLMHICHERAKLLQLEDATAWIPPSIEPIFGNMLSRIGWQRSPWSSWSARI